MLLSKKNFQLHFPNGSNSIQNLTLEFPTGQNRPIPGTAESIKSLKGDLKGTFIQESSTTS